MVINLHELTSNYSRKLDNTATKLIFLETSIVATTPAPATVSTATSATTSMATHEPASKTTFGSAFQDLENEMEETTTQEKAVRKMVKDINEDLKGDLTRVVENFKDEFLQRSTG